MVLYEGIYLEIEIQIGIGIGLVGSFVILDFDIHFHQPISLN